MTDDRVSTSRNYLRANSYFIQYKEAKALLVVAREQIKVEQDDKNTFSPGETIIGKITIEDSKVLPKIRNIEVILEAIEFAQAKGKKKRSKISPEHKEKIDWNEGSDNSSIVTFEMHFQNR